MLQTALQCKECQAIWTRHTLLDDACPECGGEVVDITGTQMGQEFLRIIIPVDEVRSMNKKTIYATGPSSIFSSHARKL